RASTGEEARASALAAAVFAAAHAPNLRLMGLVFAAELVWLLGFARFRNLFALALAHAAAALVVKHALVGTWLPSMKVGLGYWRRCRRAVATVAEPSQRSHGPPRRPPLSYGRETGSRRPGWRLARSDRPRADAPRIGDAHRGHRPRQQLDPHDRRGGGRVRRLPRDRQGARDGP